ncbi:hypothetical protein [Helicobacter acinonychis]|uniref:hypothetical protein n=1 Tax=Helicobacter acinonychis TaxID=212 RepID=UPI000CF12342|nr:hypothetical protein [Helicobacter acinonychis]
MINLREIERIENKYLEEFYHFLKYCEDEMMQGFLTKEKIKDDWIGKYDSNSDFAVGADMFFEVEDAFIHIDLKTVQTRNIGDFCESIFVGTNQNSYQSEIVKTNGESFEEPRIYKPALPYFYNQGKVNEKICLTYFISILYEDEDLNILNINLMCMPNGLLAKHYGTRVLKAGKNLDKARFHFAKCTNFECLDEKKSRIKVIYFDRNMKQEYKNKLSFIESLV